MNLTRIEVTNSRIVAHYKNEIDLNIATPDNVEKKGLNFLWKEGFEKFIPTWYGFGFALKAGNWYSVDVKNQKIEDGITPNPCDDDYFIYSKVVSEWEYGQWVKKIPIIRKRNVV